MSFLTELGNQLQAIWNRWSRTQQFGMVAAVVISLGGLIAVAYWATSPEYVVLADKLGPSQTAEYVSSLEAANISYKLNFAGSAILVARGELNRARIEVKDLIDLSTAAEDDIAGSLWEDPTLHHVRLLKQKEGHLARTIEQMRGIRQATVHITQPEPSPFIRNRAPTKASVTLDLQPGGSFYGSDAAAVVSMIAHSVENLLAENITVVTTDGRMLSVPSGSEANVSGQLEYRTNLESRLSMNAESLLVPLLGVGKATVRVTADVDFTETERTQKTVDPDSKAKVVEEVRTESFSGSDSVPLGPPGVSTNLTANESPPNRQSGKHESEDLRTEYINSETTDFIKEFPGRINRLTVAAVVELPESTATTPDAAAAVGTLAAASAPASSGASVSREQIERMIKNAVGFDEARGDQIEVVTATLAGVPVFVPPTGFLNEIDKYTPLLKTISLGVAAIVALLLGMMTIRRLTPVVVSKESSNTLSPEVIERLNSLSEQMQQHPDVVTTVLATWLDQQETEEQPAAKPARRAA